MAEFEPIPEEILQSRRSSREDKSSSDKSKDGKKSRHHKKSSGSSHKSGSEGHHHNKSVNKSFKGEQPLISDLDPPPTQGKQ